MKLHKTYFLFTAAVAIGLLPSILSAQSTISGVLTDPSGSVMPGVQVGQCSTQGNPAGCGIGGAISTFTTPRILPLSLQFMF